ncbi:MAG: hypothetical protein QOG09_1184 [Solirubrobacterales bacterium]|nr:hypothetical protein [Solirubrobacterales bacterium]
MPLKLIVGPPNSGRAGLLLDSLAARLGESPVLVVPTLDDAYRFEQDLHNRAQAPVLGASITVFRGLFVEVARACGAEHASPLSEAQRLWAVRAAIRRARPRRLGRSAARPGFAIALAELIDDVGAAGLDALSVAGNATAAADGHLSEIARLHAAYAETAAELGRCDEHAIAREATAALRRDPARWGARPVFVYGFDDLSVAQLELVAALAEAAEVTATVTYEDRAALSARASLRQELVDRGGEIIESTTSGEFTRSPALRHLERSFLEPEAGAVEPDDGLVWLEAAGERGQAEQIGQEIVALLDQGVEPDRIAVALRDPDRYGLLYRSVLGAVGIPLAIEARIPLGATATGRCLLALLQARFGTRTAEDVLAFARTPGRMAPGDADWLERSIRRQRLRSAQEVVDAAAASGKRLHGFDALDEAQRPAELLRAAARLAKRIAEYPLLRQAAEPDPERRLELRAGAIAAEALAELAEVGRGQDAASEAIAALEQLRVPLSEGPPDGRVRVTSPYRVRAAFVSHLFVASLQEGEFPRPDRGEPLLSDEQRASLGLAGRVDPAAEERYLFYVCLSRPTERLYLCWRGADEEGVALAPSPFLDDVRELLAPAAGGDADAEDPVIERFVRRRSLASGAVPPRPGLAERAAAAATRAAALPVGLSVPAVREHFAGRSLYSASQLEQFRECSYRWFVGHELRPEPLELDREALDAGGLIHAVLERLYAEPPGGDPRPRPQSLEAWRQRATELIAELAPEYRLGGEDPASRAAVSRTELQLRLFLERETADGSAVEPRPELLEASFGHEGDERSALTIGDFELRGKIDRVDVDGGGRWGILRDYKTSREIQPGAKLEEAGKLQLQLYASALRRLWEIEPLGSVYEPLAAKDSRRARGVLREPEPGELLDAGRYVRTDVLPADEFDAKLAGAEQLATELVGRIRGGDIRRDPLGDECPRYCTFAPICRRERARPDPEEDPEELE